jgi:hypothetical protein
MDQSSSRSNPPSHWKDVGDAGGVPGVPLPKIDAPTASKRGNPRLTDAASRAAAEVLAGVLGEVHPRVTYLLARIVFVAGAARVQAVLEEAQAAEAAGGLLRADGTRRTLGGAFFHLAKHGQHKLTGVQRKRCGLYYSAGPQKGAPA